MTTLMSDIQTLGESGGLSALRTSMPSIVSEVISFENFYLWETGANPNIIALFQSCLMCLAIPTKFYLECEDCQ